MSKFVLTAQLKLQAPTNTRQVINQMRGQLQGLNVPVQVTGASSATKQINKVTAATKQAAGAADSMGRSFGLALKRFAAFTVASRAVSLVTNTLANAVDEAIDFQRELVKISQVTGKSMRELKGLNKEITNLSKSLGTSSKELLGATRILAQAGIQANDLKIALDALAKTTLAPTFEDINKTAEGAVAILAQFGQGVGKLKEQLGAINAVAGQFAVESGDLIGAIRRTGGVFKAAGGDLNEFLGLFTSIRATTRESAESIATGLRTILTRIQRPATIQYLKELGVTLTDVNGRFVGPFEAVKRLSKALADVPAGDLKFVQIAEQLGGFRQIGKVIPLLQEFETAERARQAAVAGAGSLDKDAASAQQALAVQIQKTKEEFLGFVRSLTETSSFQIMVKTTLNLANAFLSVAEALKPLIPLIGAFAAFKFAGGLASFGKGAASAFRGVQGKAEGGRVMAFARGGMVPGTGNRDTVPAMLQPGEFVIRKSSVKKLGAGRLAGMNKYAAGGQVSSFPSSKGYVKYEDETFYKGKGKKFNTAPVRGSGATRFNEDDSFSVDLQKRQINLNQYKKRIEADKGLTAKFKKYQKLAGERKHQARGLAFEGLLDSLGIAKTAGGSSRMDAMDGNKLVEIKSYEKQSARDLEKNIGDKMIGAALSPMSSIDRKVVPKLTASRLTDAANKFDLGQAWLYQDITPAELTAASKKSVGKNKKLAKALDKKGRLRIGKFAAGGIVGTTRVGAAILDPDEPEKSRQDLGNISKADVIQNRRLKADKLAQKNLGQYFNGRKYTLTRKGLNQKTSDNFKKKILDGMAVGLDHATMALGTDLGIGGQKLDENSKNEFIGHMAKRGAPMGNAFEAAVSVLDGKGKFVADQVSSPFDFPGGIGGALADNFSGLPGTWVDAKTSYREASKPNFRKKIANQIADEFYASGLSKPQKKAAKGGSISGKDTVPALLTPGEFVVNKKSAQSIGYASLNRMNKKGVAGFNAGGTVGVQKFAAGGGVGGMGMGAFANLAIISGTVSTALGNLGDKSEKASDAQFAMAVTGEKAGQLLLVLPLIAITMLKFDKAIKAWTNKTNEATKAAENNAKSGGGGGDEDQDAAGTKAGAKGAQTDAEEQKPSVAGKAKAAASADAELQKNVKKEAKAQKKVENATQQKKKSEEAFKAAQAEEKAGEKAVTAQRDEVTQKNFNAEEKKKALATAKEEQQDAHDVRSHDKKNVKKAQDEEKASHKETESLRSRQVAADKESMAAKGQQAGARIREQETAKKVQQDQGKLNQEKNNLSQKETSTAKKNQKIDSQLETNQRRQAAVKDRFMSDKKEGKDVSGQEKTIRKLEAEAKRLKDARAKNTKATQDQKKKTVDAAKALRKSKTDQRSATEGVKAANKRAREAAQTQTQLGQAFSNNGKRIKKAEISRVNATSKLVVSNQNMVKADLAAQRAKKGSEKATRKANGAQRRLGQLQDKQRSLFDRVTNAGKRLVTSHRILEGKQKNLARAQKVTGLSAAISANHQMKANGGLIRSNQRLVRSRRTLNKSARRLGRNIVRASAWTNKWVMGMGNANRVTAKTTSWIGRKFVNGIRRADIAMKKLSRNIDRVRRSGDRAGPGMMRQMGGGMMRMGSALGGIGMMAGMMGQAISSGISEIAQRRSDQAVGSGNVRGAAGHARAAAMSEGMGRMFSLGGIMELVSGGSGKFMAGVAQDVQNRGAMAAGEAARTRSEGLFEAVSEGRATQDDIGSQIGQISRQAIAEIDSETKSGFKADEKTRRQAMANLKESEKKYVEGLGKTKGSLEELMAGIDKLGGGTAYSREQLVRLAMQSFKLAEAQRALAKAQFDNLKVMSAFNRAGLAVNKFLNSLNTGSSTLADSIATVEAAATNMGMGGEGAKALEDIRQRVLNAAAGGDETTAQGQAINRQFARANVANEFMSSIQSRISNLDINTGSEEAAKQRLETALLAGVTDADVRAAIQGQIAGMGDIRGKDASALITQITAGLGPLREGAMKAATALLKHEQTILKLTQRRRQTELQYIAVQRQVIDAQLRFAKTFEEFGGSKLTSDQKLSANLAKFNLGARDAGVRELRTGSVADIQSVAASIQTRMNQQQIDRQTGQFRDVEGLDKDRIKETNASIKDLVGFINQQIQATREQIAVIEKRNALEQSSIDSLLSGDIAGFIDKQGAAGAAEALRSGDAEMAALFSPQAMGQALKQLRAEGADSATLQRAGEIAANSVGLDDRAGQVLTGTTQELNNLRNQGQALAAVGGQVSQLMAESAKMEVASAEMAIENANVVFKNTMERAGRTQERADAGLGLARGGMVYASRGIFVPRGTDTVPAMLTPGEFVVNRAAVHRGNNLQVLRAMNGNGATVGAGPAGAANMSGGGQVGYYQFGDLVRGMGSIFSESLPNLKAIFDGFSSAVANLSNLELGVTVNKPIDVNVRLLNDNILKVIDDKIAQAVLDGVAQEAPKWNRNQSGGTQRSEAIMPK